MKKKVVIKTKKDFSNWIKVSNLFAKSLISPINALKQFNKLDSIQRKKIKQNIDKCDEIRRKQITKNEGDYAWELSIMVDLHIIATEFDIDPLTVIMCVNPICNNDEYIVLK